MEILRLTSRSRDNTPVVENAITSSNMHEDKEKTTLRLHHDGVYMVFIPTTQILKNVQ
jgi:hypothetical protein